MIDDLDEFLRELGPDIVRDAEWRTAILPRGRHGSRVRRSRRRWQRQYAAAIDAQTVREVRDWGKRMTHRFAEGVAGA